MPLEPGQGAHHGRKRNVQCVRGGGKASGLDNAYERGHRHQLVHAEIITSDIAIVYCSAPHLFHPPSRLSWPPGPGVGRGSMPQASRPAPHRRRWRPQLFSREVAMLPNLRWISSAIVLAGLTGPACADVITDWNEKAVAFVTARSMLPPQAERAMAAVHLAMFDAVNSIDRRYLPYALQLPAAKETSKDAAAAAAAAAVLTALHPNAAD